jgi:hypothetical protein
MSNDVKSKGKKAARRALRKDPYTPEARAAVRAFLERSLQYLAVQPFDSEHLDDIGLDKRIRTDPETLVRLSCEIVTDICTLAAEEAEFGMITEAMVMIPVGGKFGTDRLLLWKEKRWKQIGRSFVPPKLYVFTDRDAATFPLPERYSRVLKLPIPGYDNVSAKFTSSGFGGAEFRSDIEISAKTPAPEERPAVPG